MSQMKYHSPKLDPCWVLCPCARPSQDPASPVAGSGGILPAPCAGAVDRSAEKMERRPSMSESSPGMAAPDSGWSHPCDPDIDIGPE